jgi:hypothetical protein
MLHLCSAREEPEMSVKDSARKSVSLIKSVNEVYCPGAPYGLTATHRDQVCTDLPAFSNRRYRLLFKVISQTYQPIDCSMNRLNPVDPGSAEGKAKTLLDGVKASLGSVPNMFRLGVY